MARFEGAFPGKAGLFRRAGAGAGALQGECPPAQACGQRLLLDFALKRPGPHVAGCLVVQGQEQQQSWGWEATRDEP